MSGHTNFAVVWASDISRYIVEQLLKDKAAGIIKEVVVLTHQVMYPSYNQVTHDVLNPWLWILRP